MKFRKQREISSFAHHELLNWARWCWLGKSPIPLHSVCKSLECNYSRISDEEEKAERKILPNNQRAEIVQAAWEALPKVHRLILVYEYPNRVGMLQIGGSRAVSVRLGLSQSGYEEVLARAVHKIILAFEGNK